MNLPKVTIQIVTWNSMRYLKSCLSSIFESDYRDFQVLVVDNNSSDDTVDFIRKNYPEVTVFQNKKNIGFARANNQGIRLLHSPYILFCNPDIVLASDWLSIMMKKIESEQYSSVGSLGGKLLKLKLIDGEVMPESFTKTIDSCGLSVSRCRRITEIGSGQDSEDFKQESGVFGHSGALVMYRRKALEAVMMKIGTDQGEYFDEDFSSYKEDVDLAWRLRLAGWNAVFIPEAVAYHVRSVAGSENDKISLIIKNRRGQSSLNKYYSYRNHLLMLIKNEHRKNFFKNFFSILIFELKKFVYVLFFETKNISAWWSVMKLFIKMMKKRKISFRKAKVDYKQIYNWIR